MKLPPIPDYWLWKSVSELGTSDRPAVKAGPFGSALKKEFYVESGYRVYGQEQVIAGDLSLGDYYINQKKFESLQSCEVKTGDILISLVGTFGKILVVPDEFEPGIINPRLVRLSLDSEKIDPYFFSRFFESPLAQLQMDLQSHGGTMGILNAKNISGLVIPLPPLAEQRRIAAILDKADAIRRKRKQAIQYTEELLRATFLDMFGDPVTNPKGWKKIKLSKIVNLINGRAFKPSDWVSEGLPIIRIQNLKNPDAKYNYFDGEFNEKFRVKQGDLLLSWSGQLVSFGTFIWQGSEGVLNQHIFNVRPRVDAELEYLEFALGHVIEVAKNKFHGIEMKHLTKTELNNQLVLCPHLEMQTKFAEQVRKLRSMKSRQEEHLDGSDEFFSSLLQRAFQGEL